MDDLFMIVCFKEILRCSKMVVRVFHGNFKGFSRVFQGLFKESSSAIQESFSRCSLSCQGCSSLFLKCLKSFWRNFQEKVQCVF